MNEIQEIPISSIKPDLGQPRKYFDQSKIMELAESIKIHGLLQPILVRPIEDRKFQVVHGDRRWRACKLIGLANIKAEVKELNDNQVLEIQLVENSQREDLNPIEEAETFQRMKEELSYTHKGIAKRIGKSREYVTNRLRLLKLPLTAQEKLREGKLSSSHGEAILSIKDTEKREKVSTKTIDMHLTVRETRDLVNSVLNPDTNVLRRTSSDIPENEQIIPIWVDEETLQSLYDRANSNKITVEKLCSQIVERGVKEWQK